MKSDFVTSIIVAIVGAIGAYLICNLLFAGEPEIVEVKTIENSDISSSIAEPNPELFNIKALNPTVEVYIGECSEFNDQGECLDDAKAIKSDQTSPVESSGTGEE